MTRVINAQLPVSRPCPGPYGCCCCCCFQRWRSHGGLWCRTKRVEGHQSTLLSWCYICNVIYRRWVGESSYVQNNKLFSRAKKHYKIWLVQTKIKIKTLICVKLKDLWYQLIIFQKFVWQDFFGTKTCFSLHMWGLSDYFLHMW